MTILDEAKPAAAVAVSELIKHSEANYYPTERDLKRFAHIGKLLNRSVGTGTRPYYDSVVIAGAGFTASMMAARLARSEQFHGKVVLAGPRTENPADSRTGRHCVVMAPTNLLCAGRAAVRLCRCLVRRYPRRPRRGNTQSGGMAKKDAKRSYEFGRIGPYQGGRTGYQRPLFYGARNSRMQGAMYELMDHAG